ncbi:RdRP-domain-containing protein [Setomelanomma holmii]|uniref:RdRP-domain-containing protein n=1 Tax=Setomelanomma holmii TaxID=210430 RepID=A0A9P4HA72_9PLEO|nr:RdRP-domain-containing protein [Setomelanomma holmii]
MDPFRSRPDLGNSVSGFDNNTSRTYHGHYAPLQRSGRQSQAHSEGSSDVSSTENMDSGYGGYQRGGRSRGRGARGGFRGGRGDSRKYSGSSGSSNGSNRPVLRPTSAPRGRVTPPDHTSHGPSRVDSPVTPDREQTSFTMNGHTIKETYIPTGSAAANSPQPFTSPPTTPSRTAHSTCTPSASVPATTLRQLATTPTLAQRRPVAGRGQGHWAYEQEFKIRLSGLPTSYWTRDVFNIMSSYSNITRIDMQKGMRDNSAWVVFQPPPPTKHEVPRQIQTKSAIVRSETFEPSVRTVPSPLNPSKQYYEFNILFGNSIDFGTRDADMSMIAMHTTQSHKKIQVKLDLSRKELDVQFPVRLGNLVRRLRFQLPIALLSHIYLCKDPNRSPKESALIIPFDSPPQFYTQKIEGEDLIEGGRHTSFSTRERKWNDWNTWFRETNVVDAAAKQRLRKMPLMNDEDAAIIDIGRWTTYRLCFDDAALCGPQYEEFSAALADHGVEIHECHYDVKDRITSPLPSLLQEEISGTHPHLGVANQESGFDDLFGGQVHLTFPVRYQLEACLSNGYLKEHNITKAFLEKLAMLEPRRALYILEKVVDKQHIYYDPMEIFKIRTKDKGSLGKNVPNYCILLRSAVVTPTLTHVASPVMETSNRIMRKYAADADRFIRIKFSDEKSEGPLRSMPNNRTEAPFDRVRRAMKNGIVVAGRLYEFLAFGNSQFREHGAYFYAPTSSKSADDIRLSLGHFDHIKTVAKFGARLGQCFSTTRAMRVSVKIVKILDVERHGYCFTDGVGKLSLFLAQMAAQELGLSNPFDDPPSLFQFRLGGCKGVLALDPKITGSEVHIRPSQQKFEAEYTSLEIIRSSALATPYFNRQIIMVLSTLGVPDHVFIRKQQEMVNDYELAMTDETTAVLKLRKHIDMNQTTISIAGMVLDGFMRSRDPFVMSLLKLWRASTIKNLKERARIAIEDGAFVLGCVDETATLQGHLNDPQSRLDATREEKLATMPEIFLQVNDTASMKSGHYKIVEGICLLARNPSLHPGDLRIVRAVNVPALHHLKNVVVLPQTGDRDLANMCSGGDLDGDDYMVLWDVDLLPRMINDGPITVSDITEFFITYMQNSSLGQIAHAHLGQADFQADGVMDDTCLELAKLHSQAVDYSKSGIPAILSQGLRPKKWPHFMEKKHLKEDKIYKSKKILGMLYDQVQLVDFKPQWKNPFDRRVLDGFNFDNETRNLEKAAEIKDSYDEALRRLMAKHGIRTEFEAWSVFVLDHNHESGNYKFAEEFGRTIGALKAHYKEVCREAAGVTALDGTRLGLFVSAMYTVTARQMEAALTECWTTKTVGGQEVPLRPMDPEHMPFMSFPWLFASELGKIASGRTIHQQSDIQARAELAHSHRSRKPKDGMEHPDAQVGTLEIEGGVKTHYGELLKLDFGTHHASDPTEKQKKSAEIETQKKEHEEQEFQDVDDHGHRERPPVAVPSSVSRSPQSPISETNDQKQNKKAWASAESDNHCGRALIEKLKSLEVDQCNTKQGEDPSQQVTLEIKLDGKEGSAIDRLLSLG